MIPVILRPGIGDYRPSATLYYGKDVRETLKSLPSASLDLVCTSPPYWGHRDYGAEGQIGLEDSPEQYLSALVEVFREVRRVLKPEGTLWVNLGDSSDVGAKSKNLLGLPWKLVFALQKEGWILRQDIVWAKPNPIPESVSDRPTRSHEYLFLLSHPDGNGKYFYDLEASKEKAVTGSWASMPPIGGRKKSVLGEAKFSGRTPPGDGFRNLRSVWTIPTARYSGGHFAAWPPELVRRIILAGCPFGGTVLDPFSGSATTGMVALREGRNYIGVDLNPDYLELATARIEDRQAPQEAEPVIDFDVFSLLGDSA